MKKGMSIIEVILAMGLFVLFSTGALSVVLQGLEMGRGSGETVQASHYANEGIEATRSIKNQLFSKLVATSSVGVVRVNNLWDFGGVSNTFDKYTRVIKIEDVYRDTNGNIVSSGGTLDNLTKKVTSTVSWLATSVRPRSIEYITYLSDFKKPIIGDWSNPSIESTINIAKNGNGIKIKVIGNYAYIVRTIGTPNFVIYDLSNLQTPTLVGSLTLTSPANNLFILGQYAYLASTDNNQELQIVNVSNPSSPTLVGTYNGGGTANSNDVFIEGNYAYLVRDNSTSQELFVLNISNPTSPTLAGSLNLLGNIKSIIKIGNYLYLASTDNNQELQIINISNPGAPTLTTSLGLTGNNDAISISGLNNTIYIGRTGGGIVSINITNPPSPSLINTLNIGGDINDISINNDGTLLFLATSNTIAEFRVINANNPLTSLSLINMTSILNGVYYDQLLDRAFVVGNTNNAEFFVIKPN